MDIAVKATASRIGCASCAATGIYGRSNVTPTSLRRCCQKRSGGLQKLLLESDLQAGELGFEPRQTDPESVVLPLHYSPKENPDIGFGQPLSGCPAHDNGILASSPAADKTRNN